MTDYLPTMAGSTTPDTDSSSTAAGPQTLRVVHLTGSHAGTVDELTPSTVLVGRHPESRVRFDHTVDFLVSTRHGQLAYEQGQWYFVDTGSTNGTWVNGGRVQKQALSQGMLVVLGTPGAAGSASFKVDFDGSASAGVVDGDAAFAQEPPSSSELVRFICQNCGALDSAPAEDIGQSVECGVCGKKTKVIPAPARPAAARPAASTGSAAASPSAAAAPGSQHPKAVVPTEGSFFGGIIGNVKGTINRIKERRELSREVAGVEAQLPALESAVQQACRALGHDLWQTRDARLNSLSGADQLAGIDQRADEVGVRRKAAEQQAAADAASYQQWMEEWQARHTALEADLALAVQTQADADAELKRSREAVVAVVADRATALATAAAMMAELSGEARGEPKDDFAIRYQSAMDELAARLPDLRSLIPGWPEKVQARSNAVAALQRATQAHADAVQKVAASKQEKAARESSRKEQQQAYERQLQAFATEVDRIRQQSPPAEIDLGRAYAIAADAPPLDPPPASLAAARRALDQLKQAQATIAQKKQRIAELD